MMKKYLKKIFIFFILLSLTSCKGINFDNKKTMEAEEFPAGEVMVFVTNEKNKYENRFGKDIWKLKSGDGSLYFKDYVVDNVRKFVEKMMTLKLIAKDLNITISNNDIAKLEKAGEKYYFSLTEGDRKFMNSTLRNIKDAFIDYHIARLTIDNLSKEATRELSISEAKVIRVQYMVLDDEKTANDILALLNVKGASFSYYAKSKSLETEIEMVVKRGDEITRKFPEVFYLSNGEVSPVLRNANLFYIFKCIDDYMVKETEERRLELLRKMKNDEFETKFKEYSEKYEVKSNATYWDNINFSASNDCTVNDFESIYYDIFPHSIK